MFDFLSAHHKAKKTCLSCSNFIDKIYPIDCTLFEGIIYHFCRYQMFNFLSAHHKAKKTCLSCSYFIDKISYWLHFVWAYHLSLCRYQMFDFLSAQYKAKKHVCQILILLIRYRINLIVFCLSVTCSIFFLSMLNIEFFSRTILYLCCF